MTKTAKIFLTFEVVTLVLLIIMSLFAYPQADDFTFANSLHKFGWLGSQINWYKTWFGRFSSTMLIVSVSYIDFSVLCKIFPILTFFGYFAAFYLVSTKMFEGVSKTFKIFSAITMLLLFVSGMPTISQGLYWFVGTATYAPANILLLMFLCVFDAKAKPEKFVLLILTGIFIIGSNEIAMLILMIIIFEKLVFDRKNTKLWLMFFIFSIFSAIVILSPGNAVRSSMFEGNHDFVLSVFKSLKTLVMLMVKWSLNPLLWIAALAFAYFRKKFNFKVVLTQEKPIFVTIFACFLIFANLFTGFWAANGRLPDRTLNTTYLIFLSLFTYFICQIEIRGLISKILDKKKIAVPILVLWVSLNFIISGFDLPPRKDIPFYFKNPIQALEFITISCNQNNIFLSYRDFFKGKIFDYRQTMKIREKQIKDYQGGLFCLTEVKDIPQSIIYRDVSKNPEQWEINVFAEYYHLDKVVICEK